MSTPFTITAPVIGHFDAKGTRHQNLCVEDASGCFRASGPGKGLRIRRTVMSEGAVFLSEGYSSIPGSGGTRTSRGGRGRSRGLSPLQRDKHHAVFAHVEGQVDFAVVRHR